MVNASLQLAINVKSVVLENRHHALVFGEKVSFKKGDVIVNVVDATNLERNLFFTFQLLDLKVPMILAINQMDILHKRNIDIDFEKLEKIFKLPVLPLVAVHGVGVHQLLEKAIEMVVYRHPHLHHNDGKVKNVIIIHKDILERNIFIIKLSHGLH